MGNRLYVVLPLTLAGLSALSQAANSPAPATYAPAATVLLFARAQCPANTFPCPTSLGAAFNGVCCQDGQVCALDAKNDPACCPSGAVCTGTAPATAPTGGATPVLSYVPNSYFSFPYAATTFGNSASCASAATACSRNYNACVTGLQGSGGYGVTIDVPGGGGTTVGGTARNLGPSATSICSSLSSQACSNLEATKCESFGKGSGASIARSPRSPVLALVAAVGLTLPLLAEAWP
ncbi:Uncharacterized protein TCAP_00796 [Tolypocladium capitatum]|uniref:Gpi-anchored protein n=1 Tax=Tolypocladium capitatum TaxID=45235 RepID=A0A2K3QP51_9HYPO|nr:Uncharacterized protein TCAP_00796 [Tolypocladium capitatum]